MYKRQEEFLDGVEITHEEFYTRLAECDELPKTSQPSPDTFMKVFNEAVAAGDDVLGIDVYKRQMLYNMIPIHSRIFNCLIGQKF